MDELQARVDEITAEDATSGWPPTWDGYHDRRARVVEALIDMGVYVLRAPEEDIGDGEISREDSRVLLGALADTYGLVAKRRDDEFLARVKSVDVGAATLHEAARSERPAVLTPVVTDPEPERGPVAHGDVR